MKHSNEFHILYKFFQDLGNFICRKFCNRKAIFLYSGIASDDSDDANNMLYGKSNPKLKNFYLKKNSDLATIIRT